MIQIHIQLQILAPMQFDKMFGKSKKLPPLFDWWFDKIQFSTLGVKTFRSTFFLRTVGVHIEYLNFPSERNLFQRADFFGCVWKNY